MDKLTGLESAFPPNEQGGKRNDLEERCAEICAIAERLLWAMGHEWHAYNFKQDGAAVVLFNVQYSGDGVTWVTSGALELDSADDDVLAERLAAWWDRQFRGQNPPMMCKE